MQFINPISGKETVLETGSAITSSPSKTNSDFPLDPEIATQTGSLVYPSLSSVATIVMSYSTKPTLARFIYLF